jgi:hypothetical protein
VRRLLVIVVSWLVLAGTPQGALAQAPAQGVGIRLLDAPTNRSTDPRAREYIVDHVSAGTTITRRVEVSNDTTKAQTVQLYAAAGSIKDGTFQFGEGRAANDLTSWTSVDPPAVTPAPGAKAVATVKIAVPASAGPGERYGVVWAELPAATPAGGGVAAINRVGVRIYLSVGQGTEPPTDFGVTALEAKRDADGNPIVSAAVQNTGGRAVDLSGELRLTNGPGGLSAGPFDAKLGTTLGIGQTEPVLVILDRAVPAGPWDARIVLRSGTTEREATATITFPASPASSSGAVKTGAQSSRGSSPLPAIVGGAVVLAGLAALGFVTIRRRRLRVPTTADH